MKILLTSLLLIFAFQISFGQEKPKAEKIDEFGLLSCCDFTNRIDSLLNLIYLEKNDFIGYVVIYSNNQDIQKDLQAEATILRHIELRLGETEFKQTVINSDSRQNKLFIFRKKTDDEFKIELWKSSSPDKSLFSNSRGWDLSTITFQKATIFHSTFYESHCEPFNRNKQFSEILSANQNLRGHIVIFENSQKGFLKTKKEFLAEIVDKYNVPQNRLRTFFVKIDREASPYHELWLVPKKKRN